MIDKLIKAFKNSNIDKLQATKLYKMYTEKCIENNIQPLTQTAFGRQMGRVFNRRKIRGIKYYVKSGDSCGDSSTSTVGTVVGTVEYDTVKDQWVSDEEINRHIQYKQCLYCGVELDFPGATLYCDEDCFNKSFLTRR
jgi:phage/plasmid-associated DNA primase